jgi:RteC protein
MKNNNLKTPTPAQPLELILTGISRLTILANTKMEPDMLSNHPGENSSITAPDNLKLKWTYSKVGLAELIYALKELGVFNNGKAELKSITACFEYMFSIDLGNITSTFQEILQRKKGFTNITDRLREGFVKKIDSSLEG